jgi:hypothetical protein
MTERYFEKFQTINYANTVVRNITQRAVVLNTVYNSPLIYYPYDIQQGERPDNIADRYYKDQYMGWILNLTNKVVDPYYDWYVDETTFNDFIIKKYGSLVNATTKVKYFRNNWYTDRNRISIDAYEALAGSLKKFYEPVYADPELSIRLLGYIRRAEDWKKTTNQIVQYNAVGTDFINDEIVDVYNGTTSGAAKIGSGQVCARTSTTTRIQHTTGAVTSTPTTFRLVGRESRASKTYTSVTLIVDNIPVGEDDFWEPVYCYDYENEINERNKSIQVLSAEYSGQIAKELKTLLRQNAR